MCYLYRCAVIKFKGFFCHWHLHFEYMKSFLLKWWVATSVLERKKLKMQSNKRTGKHLIRSWMMQNGDKLVERKNIWQHHSWKNTSMLQCSCVLTKPQSSNGDIFHYAGAYRDYDIVAVSFRLYRSVNRADCCFPAAGRLISSDGHVKMTQP